MTDEVDGGGDGLGGRDLAGTDLRGADLAGVDLSGTDLTGASLTGADLHDADLSGTDLTGADLRGADLSNADLTDADLSDASVTGADLHGATLEGTELAGADLRGADMSDGGGDGSLRSRVGSVIGSATLVLGLVALAAGFSWFWMVFVVGWVVVTPVAQWLADHYEAASGASGAEAAGRDEEAAALEELRNRYARGDIDEAEFERRVERLLETESVDDAAEHYDSATGLGTDYETPAGDHDDTPDGDHVDGVETGPERETERN